jgi:hypothetical protein
MSLNTRTIYKIGAGLATAVLLLLNVRLYPPASATYGPEKLGLDVIPQLYFIGARLRAGAGERMQGLFPEGFFFAHVLYGMSWVEVGLRTPPDTSLHAQAIQEANWALDRLDSAPGRAPFSPTLDPTYGVFYAGWSNWLRGGMLMLYPAGDRPPEVVDRFQKDCRALAQAFDRSHTPFLPAYPGQAWPVDSVVAVAALRLHDALFEPRFTAVIERWVQMAQERLDPDTGLLSHRADPETGQPLDSARGTSQSLIVRFLLEIDPTWGRAQYTLFRQQFVAPFLGAPGVREYPAGVTGYGDVDSGPLVMGFSASATVVTIGAAQVHGDRQIADALIQASEAVGLPVRWRNTKRYACGLLPIGDAFLVWAKTSSPWVTTWSAAEVPSIVHRRWRWLLHGATLLIIGVLWLPVCRIRRTKVPPN